MSDQMPHDDDLRRLYRELPADEPRAQIDDVILAAARRRSSTGKRQSLMRRLRWTIPMAAAAGVVLTLTLTRLTPERGTSELDMAPSRGEPELAAKAAAPLPADRQSRDAVAPSEQASDAVAPSPPSEHARDEVVPSTPPRQQRGAGAPSPRQDQLLEFSAPAAPGEESDMAIADAPPPALHEPMKSLGYLAGDEPAAPAAAAKPDDSAARARVQAGHEARGDVTAELSRPESAPPAAEMLNVAPAAPAEETQHAAPAIEAPDAAPAALGDNVAAIASIRGADKKEGAGVAALAGASKGESAGVAGVADAGKKESADDAALAGARKEEGGVPCDTDAAGAVAYCDAAPEDPAVAAAAAAADAEYARQQQESLRRWPFGLEPWLEEAEACRRLVARLDAPCEFREGVAVVQPTEPAMIDAGLSKGSMVTQLKLTLRNGKLATVELRFQTNGLQMLIAPEPPQ